MTCRDGRAVVKDGGIDQTWKTDGIIHGLLATVRSQIILSQWLYQSRLRDVGRFSTVGSLHARELHDLCCSLLEHSDEEKG